MEKRKSSVHCFIECRSFQSNEDYETRDKRKGIVSLRIKMKSVHMCHHHQQYQVYLWWFMNVEANMHMETRDKRQLIHLHTICRLIHSCVLNDSNNFLHISFRFEKWIHTRYEHTSIMNNKFWVYVEWTLLIKSINLFVSVVAFRFAIRRIAISHYTQLASAWKIIS